MCLCVSVYNNSGYYLLGMIVENVSGMSYSDYLDESLLHPLGLENTMYCGLQELIPHRARGYEMHDGELINAVPLSMKLPFSAGSMCSTVEDLAAWNVALVSGKVISRASYERMTRR